MVLYVDTWHKSFHGALRPHHPATEELAHHPKSVLRPLQLPLEQIMLVGRFHLTFSNSFDGRVLRCTGWALRIVIHLVQTALMERVFAQKMDGRKIEGPSTGHAPTSLEDHWFTAQLFQFLSFILGLGTVAGYQAAILDNDWLVPGKR